MLTSKIAAAPFASARLARLGLHAHDVEREDGLACDILAAKSASLPNATIRGLEIQAFRRRAGGSVVGLRGFEMNGLAPSRHDDVPGLRHPGRTEIDRLMCTSDSR
jgi:hypothetical protein